MNYPRTLDRKSKEGRSLFHESVRKELSAAALAVFVVLLAIVVVTQLSRLLGQAASGTLAVKGVVVLLGFSALNYLPVLLSLTLFISVLLTLTRSYQDSEMTVWFVSGLSLTAWIRPVLAFAAPFILTIAILSLSLTPWALSKSEQFKKLLQSKEEVASVAPGVFQESSNADRVYFFEPGERDQVSNIFVQSMQHQKLGTMVAKTGFQQVEKNGDRFLVLVDGTRYEGVPGTAEYKIMHFGRYAMRVESSEAKRGIPEAKALPTSALLADRKPGNIAELGWRIGLPLSATILALLAIPMSFVNPRAGRSLNIIMAILLYMIYNNLLGMTNVWVTREKVGPIVGLFGVHAAMLGVMALLFYRRLSIKPLFRLNR